MPNQIHTVKGAVEIESLGLMLPHEHLFTDLRVHVFAVQIEANHHVFWHGDASLSRSGKFQTHFKGQCT